jgi:hypothetical protein
VPGTRLVVHTGRVPLFRRPSAPPAAPPADVAVTDDVGAATEAPASPEATVETPEDSVPAAPVLPPVADPDSFLPMLDRYRADVLRRLVETVLEERGEGGMSIVGADYFIDGSGRRHGLDDLALACAPLELPAWKPLIADHLATTAAPIAPESLSDEDFRERLRVRLTSREGLTPSVAHLAPELLPGVAQELVLHAPGLLHVVTEPEVSRHGTYDELVAVALEHTREMVEHVQAVTLPEHGTDRITVVVGPEHFTATLATVLPQVLHHATNESDWGHGVFVAVPTRAKLLYRVVDGSDSIGSLVRLFQQAQQAYDHESGPVSPHVWWVHQGQWRQATGPDASGAPSILLREELEQEFARAGWL